MGLDKEELYEADRIQHLQSAYQYGSKEYGENEEAKKEIDLLNTKIYEKDSEIVELWQETRTWSLEHYARMHNNLGIQYDKQYYESDVAQEAKSLVNQNIGKVFEESRGAVIFRGENFGLHNRVFLSSAQNPTYEAKDLALAFNKEKDFSFDQSFISTSTEQIEYFKVVYKAVEEIDPDVARKFTHIPFGIVSLKGKKLSSRAGTIVSIDSYINEFSMAYNEAGFEKKTGDDSEHHKVVIGAVKYSMLTNAVGNNIVCDIEESVQLQGNTGPYLQYAYARCRSVLEKAGERKQNYESTIKNYELEEEMLLRTLYRFPEVVEEAARLYSPHLISSFLFDLAQKYNLFYQKVSILSAPKEEKDFRVAITAAVAQVLKNGLGLLGIEVLERM